MVLSFRKFLVKISIRQSDFVVFYLKLRIREVIFNPCSAEMDRASLENSVDLDQLASDEPI